MECLYTNFDIGTRQKIVTCLSKLTRHLETNSFVLVGGIVIRHFCLKNNIDYPKRKFNDLDIVLLSKKSVKPSIGHDFLIYHYHEIQDSPPFVSIVSEQERIKIDMFPLTTKVQSIERVSFEGINLQIQSLEDQLVKTVQDTQKVFADHSFPVDPKQFNDANFMLKIADLEKANHYWEFIKPGTGLIESLREAEDCVTKNPSLAKEKPFRKSHPYICTGCTINSDFPMDQMSKVYRIFGYVE